MATLMCKTHCIIFLAFDCSFPCLLNNFFKAIKSHFFSFALNYCGCFYFNFFLLLNHLFSNTFFFARKIFYLTNIRLLLDPRLRLNWTITGNANAIKLDSRLRFFRTAYFFLLFASCLHHHSNENETWRFLQARLGEQEREWERMKLKVRPDHRSITVVELFLVVKQKAR
jgi:hypothetical protein